MSNEHDVTERAPERVASGVAGLDVILHGGFFRGGVYMVSAAPGSGKTILANQICFAHVAAGGRALFVTLLTESHSRMLSCLQPLAFFDGNSVGNSLSYVTGYPTLEKEKLQGLLVFLRTLVREHKATLLVIDGFLVLGSLAESELETKKFVHELQAFVELLGCTTLLLTGETNGKEPYALRTMVDGLIELRLDSVGMEAVRTLEVPKFRGGAALMGRHLFDISGAGITVYPRTESFRGHGPPHSTTAPAELAEFRIVGLDAMLGGGLRPASIAMVLGAPGSGKTLLGLSFLTAGASLGARGLYFGFFESPAELARRAEGIGIGLTRHVESGRIDMMWQSPLEATADALAEKVLLAVRERGIQRLFIDGLGGFKDSLVYPDRSRRFFSALCSELRSLGVVTLVSDQTRHLSDLEFPEPGITAMLDTVVGLRHVERAGQIRRLVSILKRRDAGGDPSPRELSLDSGGIVVAPAVSRGAHDLNEATEETTAKASPR